MYINCPVFLFACEAGMLMSVVVDLAVGGFDSSKTGQTRVLAI